MVIELINLVAIIRMRFVNCLLFLLVVALSSCHLHRDVVAKQEREKAHYIHKHGEPNKYSTEEYIAMYKRIARHQMKKYGIPASIILAQGILESNNGNSDLARYAKNHFGIKCTNDWDGKSYYKDDDKPKECFRKYKAVKDSFRDHSEFLTRARYATLFNLSTDDYKGWALGLKKAGYATNPKYPQLLINLIEKYDLQRYD